MIVKRERSDWTNWHRELLWRVVDDNGSIAVLSIQKPNNNSRPQNDQLPSQAAIYLPTLLDEIESPRCTGYTYDP